MALSDDQKALLRLLAQRDEGYEDIGALMGLSVEQVRARVREALLELNEGGSSTGRDKAPSAAGPVAAGDPPPPAVAEASSGAVPPAAPPAARAAPPPRLPPELPRIPRRPARAMSASPVPSLIRERRRLFELAGGALIVILLVLFATGVLDIGGGESSSESGRGASKSAGATEKGSKQLTQAVLKPVGGGSAVGRALFGRVGKNVVLQVVAQGLEPSPAGQSYTVWLYRSPKLVLRVGGAKVGKSGGLAARFPIPAELLAYVAGGAFKQIDVSLVSDAAYEREVAQAKREKRLPPYTGTDVLRGEITGPIVKK